MHYKIILTTTEAAIVVEAPDQYRANDIARYLCHYRQSIAPPGAKVHYDVRLMEQSGVLQYPVPEVTIVLNGKEVSVPKPSYSYAEIVSLAGMTGQPTVVVDTKVGSFTLTPNDPVRVVPQDVRSITCIYTGNA